MRILRFRLQPAIDVLGEAQLGELAAGEPLELGPQRRSIEARGRIGAVLLRRPPLHEQPLDAVERRERLVAGRERAQFGADAEQLGDEILEHGRERDDEIGFRLARHRGRRRARGHQPGMELAIALREESDEAAVEAHQSLAVVKIREPQIEAERQTLTHHSKRPRGCKSAQ